MFSKINSFSTRGIDGYRIFTGRPIEETTSSVELLHAVFTDFRDQKAKQTGQIIPLLLQVSQITLLVRPVTLDQHPPDGVTAHPIHPPR